jgi:membrane protease YdiL (CAAX protease family)
MHSLPDPIQEPEHSPRRNPLAIVDLIVFGLFFTGILFLVSFIQLPLVYAIPLQGAFNIVIVAFLACWIKLVRRQSFGEFINWFRSFRFPAGYLISLGASAAITVLVIASFLPRTETPIEKLLTSNAAISMFVIFGIAVAPVFEEIIFRGFLFKVFLEIAGAGFAIISTAAVFALSHALQLAGNWPSVILIFAVGCVLSVIRYRSNSIIPTLIIHTSYNATLFGAFVISAIVQKVSPS